MAKFKLFLITAISVIPLVVYQSRFEFPKVFLFLCLGILLIVYFLLNSEKLVIIKRDVWYLLWVLVLYISSPNIIGGSYRNQGIMFFICLWLLIKFALSLDLKSKKVLYRFFSISIVIEAILVILGYKLGTIGDINAVSGFISIGMLFVLNFLSKWLVIVPISAMAINFSKSGFLSLLPYFATKRNLFYITIFVILIFIVKPIKFDSVFENRQIIWNHAANIIKEKPFLGHGAESNERLFNKAFYESGFPLSNLIVDRAHNLFLDVTIWSGVVGLILFSGFLFEMYKEVSDEGKKIILSFLVFSFFQPLSVVHWILFALIM